MLRALAHRLKSLENHDGTLCADANALRVLHAQVRSQLRPRVCRGSSALVEK